MISRPSEVRTLRQVDPDRRPANGGAVSDAAGSLDLRDAIVADERGVVLPLMALLLVVLLGAAGFAVDLGWLYWNSIEIQHGADAASLGGVVYVAEDAAQAKVEGRAAAASNGYVDSTMGGPDVVAIIDFTDDPTAVSECLSAAGHGYPRGADLLHEGVWDEQRGYLADRGRRVCSTVAVG
jgi:hypothetical protein